MAKKNKDLLARLDTLSPQEVKRLLVEELTRKKLGLVWETDLIERDAALNADVVLPVLNQDASLLDDHSSSPNLIIEGDNFDSLRLLKSTHRGKIRVIYIDPPYNTGNKDWVYNDHFIKADDRWKHSTWLEFMYQRLTLARDLLTPDGVILISINDENRSRLELLMDEVMPGRRLGSMVWRTRQGSNDTKAGYLSGDHEHILVYANPGFSFHGYEKTYAMYSNPDNDPRGPWRLADITCSKDFKARPNLYYPLIDPSTGIHYPPNPDSTWRYQRSTMDQYLSVGQIAFPGESQEVKTWVSLEELLADIESGNVPKSGRKPLLRTDLPNLEQWIGVPVGFARPQFKRYQEDLKQTHQPLSSWIVPKFEENEYEAAGSFVSTTNHEGASGVANIFGSRVFNYAKPQTLIQQLLSQATRTDDIVLDFFAGSGTTGHAVMALNAEDGGNRRFILCSSTEANPKEPDKNICRDVCAERIRRVMTGYGDTEGLGGSFAYLTLEKVEEANLFYDATPAHAYGLLCLRELGVYRNPPLDEPVWPVVADNAALVAVCPTVDEATLSALKQSGYGRAVVYSSRPDSMRHALEDIMEIETRSLDDVVRFGQGSKRAAAERVPAALPEEGAA
jgi:adenine-specific DNA-methyltransferase